MDNRRDFLRKAALLTGALSLQNVIPMSIQKAMAINAAPGSTFYDAEHVVFLMQENRSFDHMFGKLKGVRGFNDPHPHLLPNKNKVWLQQDKKGNTYLPFHLDINKTKITWQGGLPHSWKDQVAARNGGKYDQWVPIKTLMTMGHYQREDVPFYYDLADAFTVCDHSFCSSLTGTTPNRLFFFTGGNCATPTADAVPVVDNHQAESRNDTYVDWETFPEVLEDAGIDWRVYQNEVWTADLPEELDDWTGNYGDNPLEYIARHHVRLSAYFRKNGDKKNQLSAKQVTEKYNSLSQKEKNLVDKAFTTNIEDPDYLTLAPYTYNDENKVQQTINIPKSDIFYQFRKDVDEGKLPTVSWLVAPQRFSDHTSSPLYGTWYVSEALDILTKNPEVFKKTIFILTYDENDGYFDHIPPFVVPKANDLSSGKVSNSINVEGDYHLKDNSPIGLGYRIPMIVASPWSKGGYVNSQIFDHTSSIQFVEQFIFKKTGKNIRSKQVTNWRRHICGDLTSVFRPYFKEEVKGPGALKREAVINAIQKAKDKPQQLTPRALTIAEIADVNTHQAFSKEAPSLMPKQEKGTKPACNLPYHFLVDACLNKEKTSINIDFGIGPNSIGAPFNVNAQNTYNDVDGKSWAYAVAKNDKITDKWELEKFKEGYYQLAVNGANGFYRVFAGDKNDPLLKITCADEINALLGNYTDNVMLFFENSSAENYQVRLIDDAYQKYGQSISVPANSKQKVVINLKKTKGWYNFTIKVAGYARYSRHYAGHIESAAVSTTDPLMGEVA